MGNTIPAVDATPTGTLTERVWVNERRQVNSRGWHWVISGVVEGGEIYSTGMETTLARGRVLGVV